MEKYTIRRWCKRWCNFCILKEGDDTVETSGIEDNFGGTILLEVSTLDGEPRVTSSNQRDRIVLEDTTDTISNDDTVKGGLFSIH